MVLEDEEFAADMVLLKSSAEQGLCNIQTANLDGETNLKIKRAIPTTFQIECNPDGTDYPLYFSGNFFFPKSLSSSSSFCSFPPSAIVESSSPNAKMGVNAWKGNIAAPENPEVKFPLTMTQLLLRVCFQFLPNLL